MRLNHLNLRVRDLDTSSRFYCEHFGFAVAFAVEEGNGLLLKGPGGTVLVLDRGDPVGQPSANFHFGFEVDDAATVHRLRAALTSAGCPELDWQDSPDYVSVKVADPDGYTLEVFWE